AFQASEHSGLELAAGAIALTRAGSERPPRSPFRSAGRRSEARALAGLAARDLVRAPFRVADLRGRRVPGAVQVAVDRVAYVLVRVRVVHVVVIELHGAVDGIADKAEPEPGVADDPRASVNDVVLDGREEPV